MIYTKQIWYYWQLSSIFSGIRHFQQYATILMCSFWPNLNFGQNWKLSHDLITWHVYFSRYTASKRTGVELADRAMDRWSQPREPNTNEWNTCSSHAQPNERCVRPAALWDSKRVRKQIHLTYRMQACVCVCVTETNDNEKEGDN